MFVSRSGSSSNPLVVVDGAARGRFCFFSLGRHVRTHDCSRLKASGVTTRRSPGHQIGGGGRKFPPPPLNFESFRYRISIAFNCRFARFACAFFSFVYYFSFRTFFLACFRLFNSFFNHAKTSVADVAETAALHFASFRRPTFVVRSPSCACSANFRQRCGRIWNGPECTEFRRPRRLRPPRKSAASLDDIRKSGKFPLA